MTNQEKYKAIKKLLRIKSDAEVAKMFGYKNAASFANSGDGRDKVIAGIVAFFEKIAETQTGFWLLGDSEAVGSDKKES